MIDKVFTDWNKFNIDQHVEILENEFMFSSSGISKSIYVLIEFYKKYKHQVSVVTHHCSFKKYGEAEKICAKCGYIIPLDLVANDYDILDNMIKNGYPKPKCSK